ncbi:MAG: 3-hydroxyacyl-CoA dehydrogenase family protein [Acidimicrobiales bacterium]
MTAAGGPVSLQVGVAGSGTMGAGIAECAARAGHRVILRSRDRARAASTRSALAAGLRRRVAGGKLSEEESEGILDRVLTTSSLDDLAGCELVVESIEEDLGAKRALFVELGSVCAPEALLATNTSTLPVVDLAMATSHPERVCGIHFFNPAPVMSLVELVRPLTVSEDTLARARSFAESCGKTAVEVGDEAGFVVNALLFPYLNDAVRLLERGMASREDIDAAMRGGCRFPMGPFALLDLVGLDVSLRILEALHAEHRDSRYAPAPLLRRMVTAGWLGRKAGRGFYGYGERGA